MSLLPRHYPIIALRGYTDAVRSVSPGDTLNLFVSSLSAYAVNPVRPGPQISPSMNSSPPFDALSWTVQSNGTVQQSVTPGSFVQITNALSSINPQGFTVECWVRPWLTGGWVGLVDQYTYSGTPGQGNCGFGLFIDPSGFIWFYLGDGGPYDAGNYLLIADTSLFDLVPPKDNPPVPPPPHQYYPYQYWYHIVGVYGGAASGSMDIYINNVHHGNRVRTGSLPAPGPADLILGAYGSDENDPAGAIDNYLNGDLAMPLIYQKALGLGEIATRFADRGLTVPTDPTLAGAWPFVEENGATVSDQSGNGRNGTIVNLATWMIGGPNFVDYVDPIMFPAKIPYYPAKDWDDLCEYDPFGPNDPQNHNLNQNNNVYGRGHALRLASDDIYDCGWSITDTIAIPSDAKPGLYAARLSLANQSEADQYVPFVVRSNADTKPRLVLLCATNRWTAYRMEHGTNAYDYPLPTGNDSTTYPGNFSMYQAHNAGMPGYQMGLHIPAPKNGPYWPYPANGWPSPANGWPLWRPYRSAPNGWPLWRPYRSAPVERFLHVWLAQMGYEFDVLTDIDLHADSSVLSSSQTLVINGHSEYWSKDAQAVVQNHLNNGGNVIIMSGNTMFWRVSFDSALTIMEGRKWPDSVTEWGGANATHTGEIWHSQDGQRGGLMRQAGYPAWPLTGMECVGYDADGLPYPYTISNAGHPLLNSPYSVGLGASAPIGLASGTGLGYNPNPTPSGKIASAVNSEYDVSIGSLPGPVSTPACGVAPGPASPDVLAACNQPGTGAYFDYFINGASGNTLSEVCYWDRGGAPSGAIFAAGSIFASMGLAFDDRFQVLMMNVLATFGIARKQVSISATAFSSTQNNVIAIQSDGTMLNKWFDGTNWNPSQSTWQLLTGQQFEGIPCIVHNGTYIDIVALGTNRHAYNNRWDGSNWSGWTDIGGNFRISPEVFTPNYFEGDVLFPGTVSLPVRINFGTDNGWVFALSFDGGMYGRFWNGTSWSTGTGTLPAIEDWVQLGGAFWARPAVTYGGGYVHIFAVGNDGTLYYRWWDGTNWNSSGWQSLGGDFIGSPAATWFGSNLGVCATGKDGPVYFRYWNGTSWSSWKSLGGGFDVSPAIIWSQSRLNIMLVGENGSFYNQWSYDGVTWDNIGWQDLGNASVGFRGIPSIEESVANVLEVFVVGMDNAVYHKKWDGSQWLPSLSGWDNFGGEIGL